MKSSPRPTTNLSAAVSSFVGRDPDLAAIASRLEEGRLVTILGPGGIGKTTLALRFAEERVEAFSAHRGGGVWFCDLSEARGVADIVATVAAAIGIDIEAHGSDASLSDALGRAIARRGRILIVLDNFDRLLAEAPATVGVWLRAASSARILVTSRGPLELMGEQLWSLSPLPSEHAVELFAHRARQVQPTFGLGRERATVASIVDAIDRIPLAIELAATRMAILSTSQLRERLERPLEVLAGRREVGRHASMRRTVLDSVEVLTPEHRRLFIACAMMRNGFTLEAAEDVLGDAILPRAAILDGLAALVRNSLLRMSIETGDAVARYSFFETLRDVAEELAAAEPSVDELRPRYASYYAAVCARRGRRVGAPRSADELRALAGDLENLLQAQRDSVSLSVRDKLAVHARNAVVIALALQPVLSARGLSRVNAELFDGALSALDAVGSDDSATRAEALLARGLARMELGELGVARADFGEGLRAARTAANHGLAAVALTRLGELSDVAGDTEAARTRFDEALALLAESEDDGVRAFREAEAYLGLGHARRREGELGGARTAVARAIDRYRTLGNDEGIASGLYELAVVDMFAGAHDAAFARFDEGLVVAERAGVRIATGALKTARACLLQDLGRLDEALEAHAEAARIFQEGGSRYREASATYYLATTYLERGESAECESILRRARVCLDGVGVARYEALMAGCSASALAASGDLELAEAAMERAERAVTQVRNEPALATNVRIHRLALELRKRGWAGVEAVIAEATALVAASPTDDSRFALRVLRAAREGDHRNHAALVVWPGGRAFRAPGAEVTVELPERSPLRRILEHFARRRIEAPGEVVPLEEIVRAGWPTERIGTEAALNRAYVALASLRKLGLRGLLLHGGGGYALSQAVVVRLEDKDALRGG
jgi:predicted ATPase